MKFCKVNLETNPRIHQIWTNVKPMVFVVISDIRKIIEPLKSLLIESLSEDDLWRMFMLDTLINPSNIPSIQDRVFNLTFKHSGNKEIKSYPVDLEYFVS